jgi:hypothetical protein
MNGQTRMSRACGNVSYPGYVVYSSYGVAKAGSTFFNGDKTKGFSAFVAPLLFGGASHNQILIMTDM